MVYSYQYESQQQQQQQQHTHIHIHTHVHNSASPPPLYFLSIPEESEAAEAITQGSSHGRYWGLAQQWLVDEERGEAVGRASMRRGSEGTLVTTGGASPTKGKRGGRAPELGPEVGSRDCFPPPFAPSYF